jgi:hypothetical protein
VNVNEVPSRLAILWLTPRRYQPSFSTKPKEGKYGMVTACGWGPGIAGFMKSINEKMTAEP